MSFEYTIGKVDRVFDERGNTILTLREVEWNNNGPKLELRKWYVQSDGTERPDKGFSFLTEDGPHELTKTLVELGYGDTNELMEILKNREDAGETEDNTVYYDPKDILGIEE